MARLEKGSAQMLRKLREIGVPELANPGDAKGDILDAMVVGINAMKDRTLKRRVARRVGGVRWQRMYSHEQMEGRGRGGGSRCMNTSEISTENN